MPTGKKGYKGLALEGFLARWYAKITGRNLDEFRKSAAMVSAQVPSGNFSWCRHRKTSPNIFATTRVANTRPNQERYSNFGSWSPSHA